jgi:hypothetical protein
VKSSTSEGLANSGAGAIYSSPLRVSVPRLKPRGKGYSVLIFSTGYSVLDGPRCDTSAPHPQRGRPVIMSSRVTLDNPGLRRSGADALVRARPPGRAPALIVNSYVERDTVSLDSEGYQVMSDSARWREP